MNILWLPYRSVKCMGKYTMIHSMFSNLFAAECFFMLTNSWVFLGLSSFDKSPLGEECFTCVVYIHNHP